MKEFFLMQHNPFSSFFVWWMATELGITLVFKKKLNTWEFVTSEINNRAGEAVFTRRHHFYDWYHGKPALYTRPHLEKIFRVDKEAIECLIPNYPIPPLTLDDFEHLKVKASILGGSIDYENIRFLIKDRLIAKHWGDYFGFHCQR